MNVTLDGYISGPGCELDWHFEHWIPCMAETLTRELNKADTILLGRVTYEAMADYWAGRNSDFLCPRDDIAYAAMMNRHHKAVFSNTLQHATWNNSSLLKGSIKAAIKRLKNTGHGEAMNIIVYGSGQLVASLIQHDLVDEFQLWVHPVILGKGKPLFKQIQNKTALELITTKTFQSGVVLLHYQVKRNHQAAPFNSKS